MKTTLKEYLENCGCYNVQACVVTLGRSKYFACEYWQNRDNHTIHAFYVLGTLHRPGRHVHYHWHSSPYTWYLAGYYQEDNPQFNALHYDKHFLLMPWDVAGSCGVKGIDIKMTVEY